MEKIMDTHRTHSLLSVVVLLSFMLTACATPPAAPQPTAAPAQSSGPKKGGTLTLAVWQEPEHLNWALGTQTVLDDVIAMAVDGLTRMNEKGERIPLLAAEV